MTPPNAKPNKRRDPVKAMPMQRRRQSKPSGTEPRPMRPLIKRFPTRKGTSTMRKTLMIFAALSLTACARNQAIVTIPPARCADLVPKGWTDGVPAAPVPTNAPVTLGVPLTAQIVAAIIAPWASAYVAQDGQIDKANGRTADAISIVRECEAQANAARPGN